MNQSPIDSNLRLRNTNFTLYDDPARCKCGKHFEARAYDRYQGKEFILQWDAESCNESWLDFKVIAD